MTAWLIELGVELVVMESTGIYWKSAFSHLEQAAIPARVVNAHFVKHVPGRKTDVQDSEWLGSTGTLWPGARQLYSAQGFTGRITPGFTLSSQAFRHAGFRN